MKKPREPLTPIRKVDRAVQLIRWYGTEEDKHALSQAVATKGAAAQRSAIVTVADRMRARPGWRKRASFRE